MSTNKKINYQNHVHPIFLRSIHQIPLRQNSIVKNVFHLTLQMK